MGLSPLNLLFNPFRVKNRGAFQGDMCCPFCNTQADPTSTPIGFETDRIKIRLKERLGPFIRVYKCMNCGGEWRYDVAKRMSHPYNSFKRGLKKNIKLPGISFSGPVPLLKK